MKIAVLRVYDAPLAAHWPAQPPPDLHDIEFQFDDATGADCVIVLNGVGADTTVFCPPDRVWAVVQEPPVFETSNIYRGQRAFHRMYIPAVSPPGSMKKAFWGALNWLVGKTYDELVALPYPRKTVDLCWVTSDLAVLEGQRKRLSFLAKLQQAGIAVDLWGRGFREAPVKWDVLAPSRYSIGFENFGGGIYWSEKITDSFLAFSTPFYYGAMDIDRYFPPKSYIPIDPDDPHVFDRMKEVIASNFHEENIAALMEARDLCLNKYNTLFYIAREVLAAPSVSQPARPVRITKLAPPPERFPRNVDRALRDAIRPLLPSALLDRYRQWRDRGNAGQ